MKIPLTLTIDPAMEKDFTLAQRELTGNTVDLCKNGLGIVVDVYIPEGILINLELNAQAIYPDRDPQKSMIKLTGEVRSCQMTENQYRLGILIKKILEDDKEALANFITSTDKQA